MVISPIYAWITAVTGFILEFRGKYVLKTQIIGSLAVVLLVIGTISNIPTNLVYGEFAQKNANLVNTTIVEDAKKKFNLDKKVAEKYYKMTLLAAKIIYERKINTATKQLDDKLSSIEPTNHEVFLEAKKTHADQVMNTKVEFDKIVAIAMQVYNDNLAVYTARYLELYNTAK